MCTRIIHFCYQDSIKIKKKKNSSEILTVLRKKNNDKPITDMHLFKIWFLELLNVLKWSFFSNSRDFMDYFKSALLKY